METEEVTEKIIELLQPVKIYSKDRRNITQVLNDFKTDACKKQKENCENDFLEDVNRESYEVRYRDIQNMQNAILNAKEPE